MSNKYKIIVPFYNVEKWIGNCIKSIQLQNYEEYECYLIDDLSTDNTVEKILELIKNDKRFHLIKNKEKKYALRNIYEGIQQSGNDDEDIIVTLDGDDWFASKMTLKILNENYSQTGCWLTYGSYLEFPSKKRGTFCEKISKKIIKENSYRQNRWVSSHLRTFKRHLWNRIKKEDLLDEQENFYRMTWDMAFMFPMMEMAGALSIHIPEILYCYNRQNPINDDKVDHSLQLRTEQIIRSKQPYKEKFVTCNILGPSGDLSGIGNQLFCVATTLSYGLENNFTPYFPQMVTDNLIRRYKNNFYKKLSSGISENICDNHHIEADFSYQKINKSDNNITLQGYFQSEKYFKQHREHILTSLNITELKDKIKEKFGDCSDCISIHVRRGDYLELSDYHHNLTMDYYIKAIEKFDQSDKFLIFSNDMKWCKDNFNFLKNVEFSECDEDWEDIIKMSNCKDNIIANSSFSWWGAWLNENIDKKVICPKKWFGSKYSNKDTSDLLPKRWSTI